ncbi:unnamed protein product, partial [marine sediment metagenome]
FKFNLILGFITPIFGILMPLIIMGSFFQFSSRVGSWTAENFIIYQFIAYNLIILRTLIGQFPSQFQTEKFWQTLPALLIAPFNRINLLFGIILSHFILIIIPITVFTIISLIFSPISALTLVFIFILYILISLVFSGIGIIIGIFIISKENFAGILYFLLNFIFWLSCLSYPFELFPELIQNIISINPMYYIFDIIRLAWIENDFVFTITSHYTHFIVLLSTAILLPIIGVLIFNKVFKKYGIVGY